MYRRLPWPVVVLSDNALEFQETFSASHLQTTAVCGTFRGQRHGTEHLLTIFHLTIISRDLKERGVERSLGDLNRFLSPGETLFAVLIKDRLGVYGVLPPHECYCA